MTRFAFSALLVGTLGAVMALPIAASPGVVQVAKADIRTAKVRQPTIELQKFALKNGLQVLLVEQHHAPVVTVNVTYNVGSRDEVAGRTGFAHLFEHMMFQGSENVGKAEHFALIANYGGAVNGSTSFDRTNYFELLPANQLEMALFMEADRMRSLDVSQENLDNQRNAVQEERRLRYDNAPYGTSFERLIDLSLDNFAYKHSTIGSMDDLNAAALEDVHSFFKTYYAPNNATLVIVGDVVPAEAMKLVEKYFGDLASQPRPAMPDLTEKLNKGERRGSWQDPLAPSARMDVAYPTLRGDQQEFFALDVAMTILGGNESSRIYQKLVKEQELATTAGGGAWQLRGPSLAILRVIAAPDKSLEVIEASLDEEIARMQNELVSDEELQRAKTYLRADLVSQMETSMYLAIRIGELAVYFDDPDLINKAPAMYQAVTAEDVKRASQKYLQKSNRGVLYTLPAPRNPAPAPASADGAK